MCAIAVVVGDSTRRHLTLNLTTAHSSFMACIRQLAACVQTGGVFSLLANVLGAAADGGRPACRLWWTCNTHPCLNLTSSAHSDLTRSTTCLLCAQTGGIFSLLANVVVQLLMGAGMLAIVYTAERAAPTPVRTSSPLPGTPP